MNEKFDNWEEVPDEDLFEDGELNNNEAMAKTWRNINLGIYKLVRQINRPYYKLKGEK